MRHVLLLAIVTLLAGCSGMSQNGGGGGGEQASPMPSISPVSMTPMP